METTGISLPEHLQDYVRSRVQESGFSNASEYLSDLIRADQQRRNRDEWEAEIAKGLQSPTTGPLTASDWESLRAEVVRRHQSRTAGGS